MTTQQNDSDSVTIILTFAIIFVMFISLLLEKMGSGELVDW